MPFDTATEYETPEEKLKRLLDKRLEMESLLFALNESLIEAGYMEAPIIQSKAPASGIRINDELTFRGLEKAAEFFDFLDEDNDGYLTLNNIRAMQSHVSKSGLVIEPHYSDVDVWRAWMYDMDVHIDEHNRLDKPSFVKFRAKIERYQPLARELQLHGLSYLPKIQHQWSDMKKLVSELYEYRRLLNRNNKDKAMAESDEIDTRLALSDVMFTLTNAGLVFNKSEFARYMLDRVPFERLMENLLRSYVKRQYATEKRMGHLLASELTLGKKNPIPPMSIYDLKFIRPAQLIPWLFADRPKPKLKDSYYRSAIILKYAAIRHIRYWDSFFKSTYDLGAHFRLRMIFKDFKPLKKLETDKLETQAVILKGKIGGSGPTEDGVGISWKMSRMETPEPYLQRMGLPRELGTVVIVELLLKSDVSEADVRLACESLRIFVRNHFEDELKNNLQFRGVYIKPGVCLVDDGKVIRIAVGYRRLASLDGFLSSMFIPYNFLDLVTDFTGEIKTNLSLYELFSSGGSADHLLRCTWDVRLLYRKFIIMPLLERLWLACSCSDARRHVEQPEDSAQVREQQQWRKLKQAFPTVVTWARYLYDLIKFRRMFKHSANFKTLSEMLGKAAFLNRWVRMNLLPDIGSRAAYFKTVIGKWSHSFSREFNIMYEKLKGNMEAKIAQEESERRNLLMMTAKDQDLANADANKAADIASKLHQLDADATGDNSEDLIAKKFESPEDFVKNEEAEDLRLDSYAYVALEGLLKVVASVHQVEVLSGNTKLYAALNGWDLFEFVPELKSLVAVRDAVDERRKVLAAKKAEDKARATKTVDII